ncbi:permease [Alkalispirochaeta sphaeroplastigenens]|uniref:Permease n=1 Tax=Alkalispirochaeta sphaeroplastigenens TaxID=1187066 RepID=A0A2S4JXA4_9SPIO|nr:permease [Alkalispirochaeta sphaeroplastigenens]POR04155.1 permease [Alkalispirochaeta sphaeroplastigenens]
MIPLRKLWQEPKNRLLAMMTVLFLAAFFIPWEAPRLAAAVQESFLLLNYYAREHVLLCLIPAFFIAGAITVFLDQQAVIRYLGPEAPKLLAYGVASVSGTILAVCSCTVLPLFKGIYKKGAGLGPAVSFLYSGPAINILAIILTAKVLGLQLGVARAVGAIAFAFIIGLAMHLIFLKEDRERTTNAAMFQGDGSQDRSLPRMGLYLGSMIGILVFLNWAPGDGTLGWWETLHRFRLVIAGGFGMLLLYMLVRWFTRTELGNWVAATRDFAVQILPLLFAGVMVAGFLLGRPGEMALIPEEWIARAVGTNSLASNLFASLAGALMYFATLTEVPIMQGLLGAGMNQGPALALLLAGPSLSLPALLVIGGELGPRKTLTYVALVVVLSTLAGMIYGSLVAL